MTEQRKKETAKEAPVSLDEKGEALQSLLARVFRDFQPKIGAAMDEVVLTVKPDQIPDVCRILKDEPRLAFNYLRCLSVVDYEDRLEAVYHIYSMENRHKMAVKTSVSEDDPQVPSVVPIWPAANWFEREGADLFGMQFNGHPNLAPLLLYEGFEGYPGRRSFPFHDYDEW